MFERFTAEARTAVVQAQEAARELHADHIGSEHLLLGCVRAPGSVAEQALARLGVTPDAVTAVAWELPADALDADALAAVGVDLAAVRAQAEVTFGAGALDDAPPARRRRRALSHLPFHGHAKAMLEGALREAVNRGDRHIDTGHVLLAVLGLDGSHAHRVLTGLGLAPDALREAVAATRPGDPA